MSNSELNNLIVKELRTAVQLKEKILSSPEFVEQMASICKQTLQVVQGGGTIYSCGNGGSACDAMHFNEELIARYKKHRIGIRAQHFMDPAVLTCWSNDYDFASVFERQAETLCTAKDLLFLFSTSGNSKNIIAAANAAKAKECKTIAMTGAGGALAEICDLSLQVPHSGSAERIQEVHITAVHIICEFLDSVLA